MPFRSRGPRGSPGLPVDYRPTGAIPVHWTVPTLSLPGIPNDVPAGRKVEQTFYAFNAHLLGMDQASQTLQPLDVTSTVVPLTIPPSGLYQALAFVQSKGLFRNAEEIGHNPDGKAGPVICVHIGQGRRQTAPFSEFFHLKPTLYLN